MPLPSPFVHPGWRKWARDGARWPSRYLIRLSFARSLARVVVLVAAPAATPLLIPQSHSISSEHACKPINQPRTPPLRLYPSPLQLQLWRPSQLQPPRPPPPRLWPRPPPSPLPRASSSTSLSSRYASMSDWTNDLSERVLALSLFLSLSTQHACAQFSVLLIVRVDGWRW